MFKHVFLTGPPGVGKTTLVQKACEALTATGVIIDGFYTEEVREHGRRIGFDVVTVSGKRGTLSRVGSSSSSSAGRHEPRVGQYMVDLPAFESVALPLFRNMSSGCDISGKMVFVIDEIGKMELFSQAFVRAVRQTLDGSGHCVLGTIPIPKGKPLGLVEEVRGRTDVKLFTVTQGNRNHILADIVAALQECVKQAA
ncbi:cancer-related nucleoside-triphosphatase [Scleropages formosus]|uniref:Nucleoside-triphosphatase, cancer-related n=1 Tax=Scleropages formosus TaxID=113540 RepID=A0A8C9RF65_SCLFO|nr:cancer-related nucleoside-triphosphatase [Scleropages formosus]